MADLNKPAKKRNAPPKKSVPTEEDNQKLAVIEDDDSHDTLNSARSMKRFKFEGEIPE